MAKDKRRMAKNRAKKKARQKARRKQAGRQAGTGGRFAHMRCSRAELEQSPVYAAFAGDTIFSQGIGHAIIARKLPDGRIAAGLFLIDPYCLGVKNAFLMVQTQSEFDETVSMRFDADHLQSVDPAYARKLIDDSIAYAGNLGFKPHRDYRDASVVLGGIDPVECDAEFTFGHEGKPFYVSGPNHSEATARRIIAQLRNRCGADGFHYLVGTSDPGVADAFGPEERVINEDGEEIER